MASLGNKFDRFLAKKTSKNFDPDFYGDEEREVFESEVVEVGRSSMRSSAALFDQSTKYKGKKVSRKELFGGLDPSDEEKDKDSSDEDIDDNVSDSLQSKPNKLTDTERTMRLEKSFKSMEDDGSFSMKEDSNVDEEDDDSDEEDERDEDSVDDEENEDYLNEIEEDDVSEVEEDDDDESVGEEEIRNKLKQTNISKKQDSKRKTIKIEDSEEEEDDEGEDNQNSDNDDDEEIENHNVANKINAVMEDLKENASETILKQYDILDSFMDIRLSQQETMFKANQLPVPTTYKMFKKSIGNGFNEVVSQISCHFSEILNQVYEFEEYTLKASGIGSKLSKPGADENDAEITSDEDNEDDDNDLQSKTNVKKICIDNSDGENEDDEKEDDDEEDVDEEEEDEVDEKVKNQINCTNVNKRIKLCQEKLKTSAKQFSNYRVKVLSSLSNKWKFATKSKEESFSSFHIPIHKQIEQILQDKSRLLERTRVQRSVYNVLGSQEGVLTNDENNTPSTRKRGLSEDIDIFDDGDFYQKLLMEKTKRKIGSANDMTFISKQWAELQRVRKAVKKDVDQRATKGRKTRYEVHKKMAGFMAPCKPKSIASDIQMDAFFEHLSFVHNQQPVQCP